MNHLRNLSSQTGTETPDSETIVIGPYRLLYEIGRGFSSLVYQASDQNRQRTVALKVLAFPQTISDAQRDDLTRRFIREARAISALSHPGIVAVYDAGQTTDNCRYLAMELLRGETLRARMHRAGPMPAAEAVAIALQAANALHYAHGRGIVHRDIKPDNIFLVCEPIPNRASEEPQVKLMDFGIASIVADQGLTQDGTIVGSPAYMSPEQINGETVDRRSDVFSLAVVLAEMLTGTKPFQAPNIPAVMNQILRQPPRLDAVEPPALRRVLAKALAKTPNARYLDATAFADALREAVSEPLSFVSSTETQQIAAPPRLAVARTSRPSPALLGTALFGLAALALLPGLVRRPPPPRVLLASASPQARPAAIRQIPVAWQRAGAEIKPKMARKNAAKKSVLAGRAAMPARPAPPEAPLPPAAPLLSPPPRVIILASPAPASQPRYFPPQSQPVIKVAALRQEFRAVPPAAPSAPAQAPDEETITPAVTPASLPPSDAPPRAVHRTAPTLPEGAAASQGQTVRLRVSVTEDGEVADVSVAKSSGIPALDAAAVAAVQAWEYDPAIQNGQAVPGVVTEEVKFP